MTCLVVSKVLTLKLKGLVLFFSPGRRQVAIMWLQTDVCPLNKIYTSRHTHSLFDTQESNAAGILDSFLLRLRPELWTLPQPVSYLSWMMVILEIVILTSYERNESTAAGFWALTFFLNWKVRFVHEFCFSATQTVHRMWVSLDKTRLKQSTDDRLHPWLYQTHSKRLWFCLHCAGWTFKGTLSAFHVIAYDSPSGLQRHGVLGFKGQQLDYCPNALQFPVLSDSASPRGSSIGNLFFAGPFETKRLFQLSEIFSFNLLL